MSAPPPLPPVSTSRSRSPSPPSSSSASSSSSPSLSLFTEPAGYYAAAPEATVQQYTLRGGGPTLALRLVGHNPLWGHHLWNAGRVLAEYLQEHAARLAKGRAVLELGAGAGLPALVAWSLAAKHVLVTDYPDPDLVQNLRINVDQAREAVGAWVEENEGGEKVKPEGMLEAKGYLWGAPVEGLLDLDDAEGGSGGEGLGAAEGAGTGAFDTLILGDLLFNHSEHAKLVKTVSMALKKSQDSVALVFFTPYRPWLLDKDLAFFDLAKEAGFEVEKVAETVLPEVMFKEDRGDELLRRTCFGYELRWKDLQQG